MTNTSFDANQELVGQGVANIFSSLLGGLPATGAIARTAAGIENKAKSPLAGMFHAVFVLILYFALMDVVKYIPLAVFSAILMSVAINMSRFKLFAKLATFGVRDVIILIVTCALTIIFDLTYGVIAGVLVTLALNAKNIKTGLILEKDENAEKTVIKAKGTLFFLNANKLSDMLSREFESTDEVTVDMGEIERIDETALEKIVALNRKIKAQGKSLELVGYNDKIRARLDKFFKVL